MTTSSASSFHDRLDRGPLLVAEGYIFALERRGALKAGPFVPEAVLSQPETVLQLHHEFLRAGSDVSVACTYYAHRSKLKAVDREDALEALNRQALRLARQAAADYDALTAGNLSNTWEYEPGNPASEKVVRGIFEEQVEWAAAEQADFIIAETFGHLGEARLALEAIKAGGLPAVITFSPATGSACDGYSWEDACKVLEDEGAAVVGLNCGNGPATMLPHLERIRRRVDGHVAGLPVPYRTNDDHPCFQKLLLDDGKTAFPLALDPFLLTRFEMADFAARAQKMGVDYIGICCGAGAHHVRAMAEALGRMPPASRYSPDMGLHPIFGDKDTRHQHVQCLFGATEAPGTADG